MIINSKNRHIVFTICYPIQKSLVQSSNNIENLGHGIGTSVKQIVEIFKKVNNCYDL